MLPVLIPELGQYDKFPVLTRKFDQLLPVLAVQGNLGLTSLPELLSCITANNSALRWLLLHTGRQLKGKQTTAVATAVAKQAVDQDAVVGLLLDTAALEHWVNRLPLSLVFVVSCLLNHCCCQLHAGFLTSPAASAVCMLVSIFTGQNQFT